MLDDAMKTRINRAIEAGLSRRFLANEIFAVPQIPRTLWGKKQQSPIKKLLLGSGERHQQGCKTGTSPSPEISIGHTKHGGTKLATARQMMRRCEDASRSVLTTKTDLDCVQDKIKVD